MTILLDTNILLRLTNTADPASAVTHMAVGALVGAGYAIHIVPQNLFEFWSVATRPLSINGLGLSIAECDQALTRLEAMFPLLGDTPDLPTEWRQLVRTHQCKGKVAHEARLVAAI